MARITAVIPTWNRSHLLHSVLSCLREQSRRPDQVVVVDNGSGDDTQAVAKSFGAEVIAFSENRGFAPGINAGVRQATGEWVLILNNDVVLPPDWLARIEAAAESEGAAFAAGKLVFHGQPERLDGSWDLVSRGAHAWRCGFARNDGPTWSRRRPIDFAPMTAALFQKRVFDEIGYLDERFEAYYEDVDFGLRCALAGLRGIYEPLAVAQHRSKATLGKNSGRVFFLTARNQIFLLAKHYSRAMLRNWAWAIFVGQALSLAGAVQNGHFLAAVRGVWQGLRLSNEMRGTATDSVLLQEVLKRSEREIYEVQRELGFDPYWRLYFSLVRSG